MRLRAGHHPDTGRPELTSPLCGAQLVRARGFGNQKAVRRRIPFRVGFAGASLRLRGLRGRGNDRKDETGRQNGAVFAAIAPVQHLCLQPAAQTADTYSPLRRARRFKD